MIQLSEDDSNYTAKWDSCTARLRRGMQAVVRLGKHLWPWLTWLTEQGLNQGCQSCRARSTSHYHTNERSPSFVAGGWGSCHPAWRCTVVGRTSDTCSLMGYILPSALPSAAQITFAWRLLQRMTHQLGNWWLFQAKEWAVLKLSKHWVAAAPLPCPGDLLLDWVCLCFLVFSG